MSLHTRKKDYIPSLHDLSLCIEVQKSLEKVYLGRGFVKFRNTSFLHKHKIGKPSNLGKLSGSFGFQCKIFSMSTVLTQMIMFTRSLTKWHIG